jgi:hypothetical protein
MSTYRFKKPAERPAFGPLPEGDYQFVVSECDEPYIKPESGNLVLSLKLAIQPGGEIVFANPWSGTTKDGEERDDIAVFLLAVNRTPEAGKEPDWDSVVGSKGKCRLKTEKSEMGALAGKLVNKVHYFYAPRQVGPVQSPQSYTPAEVANAAADQRRRSAGGQDDVEPQDIPF